MRATETGVRTQETLAALPAGPLTVRAEAIRLPAGFLDTRTHEGPIFTTVESGSVELTQEGRARKYGPGDFFVEPAGETITIRAVETTTLTVIRLLPAASAEGRQ